MPWIRALAIGATVGLAMGGIWAIQDTFGFAAGYLLGIGLILSGFLILVDRVAK